jgi:heme-degrading monooxygenase HmoA
VIARIWRGAVQRGEADRYVDYLQETGIPAYRGTSGNRGAWILRSDRGELTEFVTLSFWDSTESVQAFAGSDPDRAVFYPEDEHFLVERDLHVRHYELID